MVQGLSAVTEGKFWRHLLMFMYRYIWVIRGFGAIEREIEAVDLQPGGLEVYVGKRFWLGASVIGC